MPYSDRPPRRHGRGTQTPPVAAAALALALCAAGCTAPPKLVSAARDVDSMMTYRPDKNDTWRADCDVGDCEDMALCAVKELRRRGVKARIGVYSDPRRGPHAVAVVGKWLIDNGRLVRRGGRRFDWIGELRGDEVWVDRILGRDLPRPIPIRHVEGTSPAPGGPRPREADTPS